MDWVTKDSFTMGQNKLCELIERRRRQILIHSIIYYKYNQNLISDHTWDTWARELYILQHVYPDISNECALSNAFKNFDPSSGFDLPLDDEFGNRVANRLLKIEKLYSNNEPKQDNNIIEVSNTYSSNDNFVLDNIYWDDKDKCLKISVTVEGGDVIETIYK